MTDQNIQHQGVEPRTLGSTNWVGLYTLIGKETGRFMNVYLQTIAGPMVTTLLFYTVFALAFGGNGRMIGDIPYMTFLGPGLVMMSMLQNAFANTSSSLMISKVQGNIVDVLMPPISPMELILGYTLAGVIRGLVVGVSSFAVVMFFIPLGNVYIFPLVAFSLMGCFLMSLLGLVAGLWSQKFDHLAAITNFIIMPLTFLSGTFYSVNVLPPAWQAVIHANPFFSMIDGFRFGLIGYHEGNLWNGIGMLSVISFGLFVYTYSLFITGFRTKG